MFNIFSRNVNTSLPIWNKSGDFVTFYHSGGALNRRCTYSNRATNAAIEELFIGGYTDNSYQIEARASSIEAYDRLKNAVVTSGISILNYTDDYFMGVRVCTVDLNRLRHFLCIIKHQEQHFNLIEDDIVSSLNLISLNTDAPLAIWNKSGNFSLFNSGGSLNRQCTYSISAIDAILSELFIGGYTDNSYQIRARALSIEAYNRLKEAVITAGFSVSRCTDDYMKTVEVSTADHNRLRHFLHVMKQIEQHFSLIEEDIVTSLELIHLNTDTPMPLWEQNGSFTNLLRFVHGSLENRQVRYIASAEESLIREFTLYGYSNDTYLFSFQLSEGSSLLRNGICNSGLCVTFDEYAPIPLIFRFAFNRINYAQLDELLTLLSQHSSHFAEVKEQFKQHIAPVFNAPHPVLPFFNPVSANKSLPAISRNQQKLDSCNFAKDTLSEAEREQFEKYCCVLSDHVMTEPVYDPRVPQYQFEKSWIVHALTRKKEHPYTRAPLIAEQLVFNHDLKNTIDSFVAGIISAKALGLELSKSGFK